LGPDAIFSFVSGLTEPSWQRQETGACRRNER